MVTALLLIKSLHWLAQKRVEYIEATPTVPRLSHVRMVSFMVFLLLIDSVFLYDSVEHLIETRQASVSLFFSFEYIILATTTLSTFMKYVFHISDMLMEGQWEKKAVCTFYLELVRDLLHLTLCMCFFLVIFLNYGVPLHLIRELYETFRNFRIRVADYMRYRKITSNMNDRFPDATPDELNVHDATCIIYREEMTAAKKLICGHLFHVHCLRSWLERQNTCPTCRALVITSENRTSATATRTNGHPQGMMFCARVSILKSLDARGTSTAGTSSQGSSGDGVAYDNASQQQARLQAAAAAASLYEKSFVYPSPNALMWSPGYVFPPQTFNHHVMAKDCGEVAASGLSEQFSNTTLDQLPHSTLAPSQFPHFNVKLGAGSAGEPQLDLQRKLIQHQIEFLQNQLQLLRPSDEEKTKDVGTFDIKGKSVSSPSSSVIDSTEI